MPGEAFPQGMGGQQIRQPGDEPVVPTKGELGFDPLLGGGQAGFGQADRLPLGELDAGQLGQGRPPPQRQGLAQHLVRLGRSAGRQGGPTTGDQRFEAVDVDVRRRHVQQVARGP